MSFKRMLLTGALLASAGLGSQLANADELSVATFVPPTHETNVGMFKWFGEALNQ